MKLLYMMKRYRLVGTAVFSKWHSTGNMTIENLVDFVRHVVHCLRCFLMESFTSYWITWILGQYSMIGPERRNSFYVWRLKERNRYKRKQELWSIRTNCKTTEVLISLSFIVYVHDNSMCLIFGWTTVQSIRSLHCINKKLNVFPIHYISSSKQTRQAKTRKNESKCEGEKERLVPR